MSRSLLAYLLLFFLFSCSKDETAIYEVTGMNIYGATTESNDGFPRILNDSINHQLFAINTTFEIESNLDQISYDYYEDSELDKNPIITVKITSNQVFCGSPPGNTINQHFSYFKDNYANATLLEDNITIDREQNSIPFCNSIYFLCNSIPTIGNYDFYVEYTLHNGTILKDSIKQIYLR